MYSTKLKINKYTIVCVAMCKQVQIVDFIVDTGAMFTCCNYTSFDKHLNEEDFKDNEIKLMGGICKEPTSKVLQMHPEAVYHWKHRYGRTEYMDNV